MALTIGFALSPAATTRAGEAPPPPAGRLTLLEPGRDKVVHDSGAAFGRASALVPVRGTAEAGAALEARAVEGAREVVGWTEIGAAGDSGGFDLALEVPKGLPWLTLEARLRDAPGVRAATASPFAVGHVLAIWGQSEIEQCIKPGLSNTPAEPLALEDRVQIVFHDRALADARIGSGAAGVAHKHLTDADPHTAACAALANVLTDLDGQARFCVLFQAQSGTAPAHMFQDDRGKTPGDDKVRFWADDRAVHDFATADGAQVGAALMSWFASPSNLQNGYGEYMFPAMFRRDAQGRAVAIPGEFTYRVNNTDSTHRFDHCWDDLYDYARTRWVPYGPHRFEPIASAGKAGTFRDAITHADGSTNAKLRNIERCRIAWRALAANPHHGGAVLPIAVEPLNYANGEDKGAGADGWQDHTHPSDDTPDGLAQFMRLTAHAWARAVGLTAWPVPEFDGATLGSGGAWVELSASAGPVTTTRRARGEAEPQPTLGHHTEVMGFEYDGAPVRRAEIVEGRVRVHPPEGAFGADVMDRLSFGAGGGTGLLDDQADLDSELWKNVPIVDVGAARVDGIALRPLILPASAGAASGGGSGSGTGGSDGGSGSGGSSGGDGTGGDGTGGSGAAPFFTRGSQDARFADPAPIGAGVTGITVEMRVRIRPQSGFGFRPLLELGSGLALSAETRAKKRQLSLTLRDPGNVKPFDGTSATGAFEHGEWITIRASALRDLPGGGGAARVSVDGTAVIASGSGGFANAAGPFDASQSLAALAGAIPLDVASIRIWKSAREDGGLPEGAPHKVIEGDAAAANADDWKRGGDAFT